MGLSQAVSSIHLFSLLFLTNYLQGSHDCFIEKSINNKLNLKKATYSFFNEIINNGFVSHVFLFEYLLIFKVILCYVREFRFEFIFFQLFTVFDGKCCY